MTHKPVTPTDKTQPVLPTRIAAVPQVGDTLGGALVWARAEGSKNKYELALTADGQVLFAVEIEDAWDAVAANGGPNWDGDWSLMVQVVGLRP